MTGWKPPSIETERLLLRPLLNSDAEALFSYCSNPAVTQHVGWHHGTIEDSLSFIDYALGSYAKMAPDPWGLVLKENGDQIVGHVGCFWVKEPHSMEIGWILAEKYWGQGLATEASNAAINFVFRERNIIRLQCTLSTENDASRRVAEKLGMRFEGIHRCSEFVRGRFFDTAYYSILRSEWESS
ncbi:MAG: GNAT family N-acetyltransferase [Cyanobacteria bacterium NC_groundwater_1444_Ag_S-0.65um_54_12]|nr:GNAT family N-acetyltransferase [Cyanobacteria bacterium NC_groundwater_1444_Ag_S-0.65um_54_12]